MSTVLIHGAAGFVARPLVLRLAELSASRLILVDRRPVPEALRVGVIARGADVEVHRAVTLRGLTVQSDVDALVVLAGQTDVDEALAEPARAFEDNVQIAVDAAEWLRVSRQRSRLIYLSSDEVLGESFVALSESAPRRPTQPYAASKSAAEMVLTCYRDTYSLDVVIVRSCNLVGSHQRAHKLIPTAVTHLTQGEKVPIFGSGTCLREWLAVEDLCDAIGQLVSLDSPGQIYHCGSGVRLTALEVVGLVATALDLEAQWHHVQDRLVHDRAYAMDCSRLRSIGWSPKRDVSDAIVGASRSMAAALAQGEVLVGPRALIGGR